MHSTTNEGKYFVAERFISTLKSKIYKHMTEKKKNVWTDKLDHIVNEYKNTCHRTIKVKPVDVKGNGEVNGEVGDLVRISKYINIFAKGYTPNWSEEGFVIKEVKNTVPWTYVTNYLNGEEIIGKRFMKKNYTKQTNKNLG